ncbi:MAG TPA: pilus assembly protein TadG-related protein [Brevundimonas sp.]|jgi:Flp pilus assembly protein TadG|uniref:pilus assembly protein TadG-related protein n=1 Tax=Brevundimonas sp. TaxID=1871086 RepID=UPI002ED8D995
MIFALALPVLVMMVGGGIDFFRAYTARSSAQGAVDAAVLAAAASRDQALPAAERVAETYLMQNLNFQYLDRQIQSAVDQPVESHLRLRMTGAVKPLFLGIIGVTSLPVTVTATATRGTADKVELALVLDNTWSMSDSDGAGGVRITSLKSAARTLVDELMRREDGNVKIGVVPYADYVNVGTANRNQPWISVPADYDTTSARVCTTRTTRNQCTRGTPKTCNRKVDGVSENYDCTPQTCKVVDVAPYETCSGGGTTRYRWYGCVGSRTEGIFRLNDQRPDKRYPGLLSTSQNCLTPITPLTSQKSVVTSAIQNLVINVGSYRPLTYIPTGVIWGVNMLSPSLPLAEGSAYHSENRNPRKIMVLMTDGENTLRFDASNGRHSTPSGGNAGVTQLRATNTDTAAICDYAKEQNIEIFTVAFAVSSSTARDLLEGCASGSDHYFDARDANSLRSAFSSIAASINKVRLVQ